MDQSNLTHEQQIIENILNEIASVQVFGDISFKPIFDHEHGRYQVIATGWEGERQVLRTVALLEVQNGLVWLQADNTDYGIAEELMRQGIPRERIVLGFQPMKWRVGTGFATGE
jgi:XisI protein